MSDAVKAEMIAEDHPALEFKFIHASGPGGQNVNKVATAVQLKVPLAALDLSDYAKDRLKTLARAQVSQDEVLLITAKNFRTQLGNKKEALRRLNDLLIKALAPPPRPRRATKPSKSSVERRITAKKEAAQVKQSRRKIGHHDD